MKIAGRRKTKARAGRIILVHNPETETPAASEVELAIRRRLSILDELGWFLPADAAAARQKKSRRTRLKNTRLS